MIDFNNDWDEPDIWSTPTHSPLAIIPTPTSVTNPSDSNVEVSTSLSTLNLEASSSTVGVSSPISSNESFHPVHSEVSNDHSNSDPGASTPIASNINLQSYLQTVPKDSSTFGLESSSSDPKFSPPSLAANSWSSSFQQNLNLESSSSHDLFDHTSSSGFDSSVGFDQFDSHQGSNGQENTNDEDEFGDFDDGEMTTSDDNFGGFTTTSPFPPALRSTSILPVKLPDQFTEETLRAALGPPLEALFENSPSSPDSSQAWLEEPSEIIQMTKTQQRSSSQSKQTPSILKSDDLQTTWKTLVNTGDRLGRPIEWKRSQIRRLHLVHLGIPVDLNDFLAPPPMARKSLAIETKSSTPNLTGKHIRQSPTISSPFKGPMLDRRRCEELSGLSQASLSAKDPEQLESIRNELKCLNQQASDTLALKQQQRDRSIQDCQAYNTMISDLILAAQKIQMASPGSTKRASSINLGSSSISSSSTKWRPLTRRNSHHHSDSSANIVPQTTSNNAATASAIVPPDSSSSLRSSSS